MGFSERVSYLWYCRVKKKSCGIKDQARWHDLARNAGSRLTRRLLHCMGVVWFLMIPASGFCENLIDVFELALESDPAIKSAQALREATRETKAQSFAAFLPSLSVSGQWANISQTDNNFVEDSPQADAGLSASTIFQNKHISVNFTESIFNLPNFSKYKAAKEEVTKGELLYRLAQQSLLFRVVYQYFNILSSIDELDFARAEKNAIVAQWEQTKQRYHLGLIAITEVHEAQARHDFAVAQEVMSELALANAREGLREITGILHMNLLPLGNRMALIPPTPSNISEWTDAALSQNLGVAIVKMDMDIAEIKISEIKRERFPTLDLNLGYGLYDLGGVYPSSTRDVFISFDFAMPIYGGGLVSSRIKQTRQQHESIKRQVEVLERAALKHTRAAYLGVLAAMSYVKALNQALISNNKALQAIKAGFDVGARTAVDVLNAQRDSFRARRDVARARHDYVLNTLKLKTEIGLLTIDDLEQVNSWLE